MTREELFTGYTESVPVIFLHVARTYRIACAGKVTKARRRDDVRRMLEHIISANAMQTRYKRSA